MCKPLCSTTDNTFLAVFYSPYDSFLIITCSKINAQGLVGEICCRVLGELCSFVTLVLLQQDQQERWKKQALVGWSVWNYLSLTDYGLECCACVQLSASSCYRGCFGDAPWAHPYIPTLAEKPGRAEQSCKESCLSASTQLVLLWPPLVSALSGKTCRWPGHCCSQAYEQRRQRLLRDVMKTRLQRHEGVLPAWVGVMQSHSRAFYLVTF